MSAKLELPQEEAVGTIRSYVAAQSPATQAKDNVYLANDGFLYTSPWVSTKSTSRYSASILLTARHAPFEFTTDGFSSQQRAIAIRPIVERGLRAENVQLISVQVNPTHRLFRQFRAIPNPGYLALDRSAFADLDDTMDAAYWGDLDADAGAELMGEIVARTCRFLPKAKSGDPRIDHALDMLRQNPNYPLKDLAAAISLSYDRMSHLFAEVVGLPLRSYLLWLKINAAALMRNSGLTLTEIADAAGFNDSAHLCNAWQQAFGKPPSSFFLTTDALSIHLAKDVRKPPMNVRAGVATRCATASPTDLAEKKQSKVCRHCGSQHHHES